MIGLIVKILDGKAVKLDSYTMKEGENRISLPNIHPKMNLQLYG